MIQVEIQYSSGATEIYTCDQVISPEIGKDTLLICNAEGHSDPRIIIPFEKIESCTIKKYKAIRLPYRLIGEYEHDGTIQVYQRNGTLKVVLLRPCYKKVSLLETESEAGQRIMKILKTKNHE